jgi:hypothetical protein
MSVGNGLEEAVDDYRRPSVTVDGRLQAAVANQCWLWKDIVR